MTGRTVFIGNLCHVNLDELRIYCSKFGTIKDLDLHRDKEKNAYHCFAFVTFESDSSVNDLMLKRPHTIGNRTVFVKRSLPRALASIPERVIVTNRLLIINPTGFRRSKLISYFENFGQILKFDYENGILDFDDYDSIDRLILDRPNFIGNREIKLTKFDLNEKQNRQIDDEISSVNSISSRLASIHVDQDIRTKYENLEKEFLNYKLIKEKEFNEISFELKRVKEDLEDITQIKLDKLLKNQQAIHRDLLSLMVDLQIKSNTKISEPFYPSSSNKKRRVETNIFY